MIYVSYSNQAALPLSDNVTGAMCRLTQHRAEQLEVGLTAAHMAAAQPLVMLDLRIPGVIKALDEPKPRRTIDYRVPPLSVLNSMAEYHDYGLAAAFGMFAGCIGQDFSNKLTDL